MNMTVEFSCNSMSSVIVLIVLNRLVGALPCHKTPKTGPEIIKLF